MVRRGFVDIPEGQMHYREAGRDRSGALPVVLLHAQPGSSRGMAPLIDAWGSMRRAIGFDTLGMGESSPAVVADPDIAYFARAVIAALDGLGIDRFDLYGAHTGASIAAEVAIALPGRARRMICNGVTLFSDEESRDLVANYAPELVPDDSGGHFLKVWQFARDMGLFWPWYRHTAENRRAAGIPSADRLHETAVEVIKSLRTYHLPYRAAFAYDSRSRLPLIPVPVLIATPKSDPLTEYDEAVRKLIPDARIAAVPGAATPADMADTLAIYERFLGNPGDEQPFLRRGREPPTKPDAQPGRPAPTSH